MLGHLSYSKKNYARELIESEGWTKDLQDAYDARFINSDDTLCVGDVRVLTDAYGGQRGISNACTKR